MKIGFVVPGFSADEGDWCIPAHTDLVRALATRHNVHVFAMRYPHRVDTYAIGKATVHSLNGVGSRGAGSARLWRNTFAEIRREHQRGRFDVLHSIFGGEAGAVTVLAGKWLRVPSIGWLVDGELVGIRDIGYGADLYLRQRALNTLILWGGNRIFCGCTLLTQAARMRLPNGQRNRIETVPLGVNMQRFQRESSFGSMDRDRVSQSPNEGRDAARTSARFVNVGSLSPVKDQATLLRAFGRVLTSLPDAQLKIAGVGALERSLSELVRELRIESHVQFVGNVPHDRLPHLYQVSDVFVQASRHEGQGMALLEAGACGCALTGTDVGALHDLAAQKIAQVCVPGDVECLAENMCRTFETRMTGEAQAWELVNSTYNLDSIGARLEQVYEQLGYGHGDSCAQDIATT